MTIKLDYDGKNFLIRALNTPNWQKDRDRINCLIGRKPIYDEDDNFLHWEVSDKSLNLILKLWNEDEIIPNKESEKKLKQFKSLSLKINDLPKSNILPQPYDGKILEDYQENYITINHIKTDLLCSFPTGSGKCLCTLLRSIALEKGRILIIAPKRTLINWKGEVQDTLNIIPLIYWGNKKQRSKLQQSLLEHEVIEINYEMVEEFLQLLPIDHFKHVIIDECHLLADVGTKRHKAVKKLIQEVLPNAYTQWASGTPIQDKLEDLYGVLSIKFEQLLGTFNQFKAKYIEVLESITKIVGRTYDSSGQILKRGYKIKIPVQVKYKNIDQLKEVLSAITVRIAKEDIMDFKDTVDIVEVELKQRQREFYENIRDSILVDLESGQLKVEGALARMTRLLQAAEGSFNIEPKWNDSGKFEYIVEEIEEYPEKIIVWSRFVPILRLLNERFKNESVLFIGDIPESQKTLGVWSFHGIKDYEREEFNRLLKLNKEWKFGPGEARIFLGTIDLRSSLGINLQSCRKQIFSSFSWTGSANIQAADRIRRKGQKAEEVLTTFLVAEDTIEKPALIHILKKFNNTIRLLDGRESLSYNQIQELIRLLYQ